MLHCLAVSIRPTAISHPIEHAGKRPVLSVRLSLVLTVLFPIACVRPSPGPTIETAGNSAQADPVPDATAVSPIATSTQAQQVPHTDDTSEVTTDDIAAESPSGMTMLAVGDIQLGRTIYAEMVDMGDYSYPMAAVADRLAAADLTVGNLEAQIFDGCPVLRFGMRLCAGSRAIASITAAGFDVLSVANNHSTNFGKRSLDASVQLLKKKGIKVAGHGSQIPVVELNGERIAFLAYSPVHQQVPLKRISAHVDRARGRADLIAAFVHWGIEYQTEPSRVQIRLAEFMARKGVDLIIGSHPHVVQPMERVRDTLVAYSLGNFVFDFMAGEATRGAVGEFVIEDGAISSSRLIPIQIDELGAPMFVDDAG